MSFTYLDSIGFNWVQNHFFTKISDFILSLFLIVIISSFFLIKFKRSEFIKRNFYLFYVVLLLLLLEWFLNHPALRYGGFTLIALSIFIPLSIFIESRLNLNFKLKRK